MAEIVKTITKEEYDRLTDVAFYNRESDEQFYRTTWIRRFWRPAMAWLYFTTILLDFIVLPILHANLGHGAYQSITLQGGGLFHVAMGAIVGITALGRSWEKMTQYKTEYGMGGGSYYNYPSDPYQNMQQPYMGSPPVMMPHDNLNDALSNNEDEIIPPNIGTK